ncbi:hypothetical protein E2562_000162, partial [Oryza meyeriana var. granulata]
STLGAALAEIAQAIPIYLFLPGYATVPSRFAPVLAEHSMTLLYAVSNSPMALPPPSVHVHPALLETEAAPRLAPDATAPAFGSGSTSAATLTRAPAEDPYSRSYQGCSQRQTPEAPSTAVTTTTGSTMVTSSTTIAGAGSSTPAPALGSTSALPETVLDNTPASPRTAARVASFLLGT